jgi:DNA repair exonuclease SbcCD ATPase subunit
VCPRCGTECLFSRAEALENEEEQMKELSKRLAAITKGSEEIRLKEAKAIISRLRAMNMRWNIESLNQFLTQRQRELFF